MQELLKNYYNIHDFITLEENKEYTCFLLYEKKYLLTEYKRSDSELEELISLNQELINKGLPTSRFVMNIKKEYISLYNNKKYVLLEQIPPYEKEYNILDMIELNDKLVISSKKSILIRNNWADLWSAKIDYFEYQIRQLGKEHLVVINSFSYYVGLAENAIAYVNNTTKKTQLSIKEHITLQRKRINFPNIQKDFFNPLNYIIDIEVRDAASYFKSLFFNSYEDLWIEIKAYLKKRKLSLYGYSLLYARLMYPSFYFDLYEQIIEGTLEENALLPIINKVDDYELFLKDMYFILSQYAPIDRVEWIINKKES